MKPPIRIDAAETATKAERDRIINLLVDLNVIRRDALGYWVAVNTDANGTVYLDGLEPK